MGFPVFYIVVNLHEKPKIEDLRIERMARYLGFVEGNMNALMLGVS